MKFSSSLLFCTFLLVSIVAGCGSGTDLEYDTRENAPPPDGGDMPMTADLDS